MKPRSDFYDDWAMAVPVWFHPELRHFAPGAERERAWQQAQQGLVKSAWFWVGFPVILALGIQCRLSIERLAILPPLLEAFVSTFAVALSVILFIYGIPRSRIQHSLRSQLNASGLPICMKCGYILYGLTEPRCPECARTFAKQGV
jgi:hypothetical protein